MAADPDCYDDGGISGASLDRPDLKRLLADISAGGVDNVVVYRVDRLTRSLTDFARLVELFDRHGVSLSPRQEQAARYRPLSFERYAGD